MVAAMPLQEVIITKIQNPKMIFDRSAAKSAQLSNTAVSANIVEATMAPRKLRQDAGDRFVTK